MRAERIKGQCRCEIKLQGPGPFHRQHETAEIIFRCQRPVGHKGSHCCRGSLAGLGGFVLGWGYRSKVNGPRPKWHRETEDLTGFNFSIRPAAWD